MFVQTQTNGGPLAASEPGGPGGPAGPGGPTAPSLFHWMRVSVAWQSVVAETMRTAPLVFWTQASMTSAASGEAPSNKRERRPALRVSMLIQTLLAVGAILSGDGGTVNGVI